jgi:hypothetical protein
MYSKGWWVGETCLGRWGVVREERQEGGDGEEAWILVKKMVGRLVWIC